MNADPIARLNAALEGRYRVERELGEGGMATVYLADDLKHERKVALKVLKPELAAVVGAERFLAEIKTTANLQHPHILPLFDSGEVDGFLFYVMPYVEGETLRERIDRERQLGVDDALALATKVADALDYAHAEGVIHRDIKPANILLSKRGEPLVADFGIALAVAQAGGGRITETGLSLGTPHYMSPEQATGDSEVDGRSDVYALGCVLYEMLAGEPPFSASTTPGILAKILTMDAPSITMVRRTVPQNVSAAVAKALEKLPADRFTTVADFSAALSDPGFEYAARAAKTARSQRPESTPASATAGPWNRLSVALAAIAVLTSALAGWALLRPGPAREPGVATRSQVTGLTLGFASGKFAVSPDGRWIVANHVDDEVGEALYIRGANDLEWRPLANTTFGQDPAFSPDGRAVVLVRGDEIQRVPITGGPPLHIALGRKPHWASDDEIVFQRDGDIYLVSASGGEPEVVFDSDSVDAQIPHLLPNGSAVVFSTDSGDDPLDARVMLFELETGELRELVPSGSDPRYVPSGHLLYGHGTGALMGMPFDLETLQATGSPVPLLPELVVTLGGVAEFAVSETGTLIYAVPATDRATSSPLRWVDMAGNETPIQIQPDEPMWPRISPDGRLIAYESGGHIWVHDIEAERDRQLTFEGRNTSPIWSLDGGSIYFLSERAGTDGLDGFMKAADGSSEAVQLWTGAGEVQLTSISPDGRWLVVGEQGTRRDIGLFDLRADSATTITEYLRGPDSEAEASISPDGRWMAYWLQSQEGQGVFVRRFPDGTGLQRVSTEGGNAFDPVWSPDGDALFYSSAPARGLFRAEVTTGGSFSVNRVTEMFPWPFSTGGPFNLGYDIHPDGDRFVVVSLVNEGIGSVQIVTNWFSELRELMGEGN